jgi:tetratricopeptide (TPR) repeat protein
VPVRNLKPRGLVAVPLALAAALAAADTPPPAGELAAAGDELRRNGAHEAALSYYERAILDDPTSDRAWVGAAASLEALDEERAVNVLAEAATDPKTSLPPGAVAVLAGAWARRGLTDRAKQILGPEPAEPFGRRSLLLGRMHFARGDLPAAIREFKNARAAGEVCAPYYVGEAMLAAGHYEEAGVYLDEFLETFPYVAAARCARAEVCYLRGEYNRANSELAEALTYDPECTRALFDLAALAARNGDYGAAIRLYGEVTTLDPGDARAFWRIARAYRHVDPLIAARKLEEYHRRFP